MVRQLLSSGHWSFFLQFHPFCVGGVGKEFLVVVVDDATNVRHVAVGKLLWIVIFSPCSLKRLLISFRVLSA